MDVLFGKLNNMDVLFGKHINCIIVNHFLIIRNICNYMILTDTRLNNWPTDKIYTFWSVCLDHHQSMARSCNIPFGQFALTIISRWPAHAIHLLVSLS